jgi:hypothetical protein
MVYSFFSIIIIFSFLVITRDRDAFSSCFANIKALFDVFPVFRFIPVNAVNKFLAVFSASVRFLI